MIQMIQMISAQNGIQNEKTGGKPGKCVADGQKAEFQGIFEKFRRQSPGRRNKAKANPEKMPDEEGSAPLEIILAHDSAGYGREITGAEEEKKNVSSGPLGEGRNDLPGHSAFLIPPAFFAALGSDAQPDNTKDSEASRTAPTEAAGGAAPAGESFGTAVISGHQSVFPAPGAGFQVRMNGAAEPVLTMGENKEEQDPLQALRLAFEPSGQWSAAETAASEQTGKIPVQSAGSQQYPPVKAEISSGLRPFVPTGRAAFASAGAGQGPKAAQGVPDRMTAAADGPPEPDSGMHASAKPMETDRTAPALSAGAPKNPEAGEETAGLPEGNSEFPAKGVRAFQPEHGAAVAGSVRTAVSAEKAAEAEASKSAGSAHKPVFAQVAERISQAPRDGEYVFDMKLYPEGLGKIEIKMICEDGALSLTVTTHSSEAQRILSSQASELKNALSSNYQVSQIRIQPENKTEAPGFPAFSSGGFSTAGQSGGFSGQTPYRYGGSRRSGETITAIPLYLIGSLNARA